MYKKNPLAISLAMTLAAVPVVVRAQSTESDIEISVNHGHTFTVGENSQAKIVKAWPGSFESFDFGEHPKIPNAKFIFLKLKPSAKLDSTTTLTLIIDDGTGNEFTKAYVLKRVNGTPSRNTTLIGEQPIYAASPSPQPAIAPTPAPPTISEAPTQEEHRVQKGDRLTVSKEFIGALSSGVTKPEKPRQVDKPIPAVDQPQPKTSEVDDPVKSEPTEPTKEPEPLPLIRAPKTLQAKAAVETSSEKQLIERASLDRYAIANHLLKGLYKAERRKEINASKDEFGQAHSMARLLRKGLEVDKALDRSGLPPVTFDNLLGYGGVGK